MRKYDFHELLSPTDFEHFAASVLRIRDGQKIKVNGGVGDGGIDFYYLDEDTIGQVKNHRNNAKQVITSLKTEIKSVQKERPNRYVIVTAAVLRKNDRETLLSMFDGYLHKEDIIDKNDLNELLEDPKYHRLEIEYLNLLVPNSFVLSHYLNRVENSEIYTQTELELDKIKEAKKTFAVHEIFFEALDKLLENQVIILSGEAGVGKSTMARMLVAYLIHSNPDIEFLSINNLQELFKIFQEDKSQVYFFDDFWGDTQYDFRITEKEKEKILDFIGHLQKSQNKWLIITTREYVFRDGLQASKRFYDKYQQYNFLMKLEAISDLSKFNILFNHLHQAGLSWNHANYLLSYWQTFVHHHNYNPRYL